MPVSTAYRQTTVRLSPDSKAALDALAILQGHDRSTIVQSALDLLISQLPPGDRDMVRQLKERIRKRVESQAGASGRKT